MLKPPAFGATPVKCLAKLRRLQKKSQNRKAQGVASREAESHQCAPIWPSTVSARVARG